MDDRRVERESQSDGQLLAELAGGSTAALGPLIERHQAPLLRHARALVGEGGHEDAVQEAFLKLLERPPVLGPEVLGDAAAERAQLASWLHRVTRNACMDTLRSESRRRGREAASAAPVSVDGARARGTHEVEARDTRAAVETGIARLPSDQREVIVLRLLADRSYREIAEITGRKIGTVGWLVSEGLRRLAQDLSPLIEARSAPVRIHPSVRASRAGS